MCTESYLSLELKDNLSQDIEHFVSTSECRLEYDKFDCWTLRSQHYSKIFNIAILISYNA